MFFLSTIYVYADKAKHISYIHPICKFVPTSCVRFSTHSSSTGEGATNSLSINNYRPVALTSHPKGVSSQISGQLFFRSPVFAYQPCVDMSDAAILLLQIVYTFLQQHYSFLDFSSTFTNQLLLHLLFS